MNELNIEEILEKAKNLLTNDRYWQPSKAYSIFDNKAFDNVNEAFEYDMKILEERKKKKCPRIK